LRDLLAEFVLFSVQQFILTFSINFAPGSNKSLDSQSTKIVGAAAPASVSDSTADVPWAHQHTRRTTHALKDLHRQHAVIGGCSRRRAVIGGCSQRRAVIGGYSVTSSGTAAACYCDIGVSSDVGMAIVVMDSSVVVDGC